MDLRLCMKIAIVTDWLPVYSGAEHVIHQLCQLWPNAPVYTTVVNKQKIGPLAQYNIKASKLQTLYKIVKKHQLLIMLMPKAMEQLDVQEYELIVSSSHAVGKGIIPASNAVHVCYCHTPMRYAWEMEEDYLKDYGIPFFLRPIAKKAIAKLRRWDLTTAKRVDHFIANSTETAGRIKRVYGRESDVLLPPVDDHYFEHPLVPNESKSYYLAIGRLIPYKRFDLLIATANELKLPLKIAGTGQEEQRLKAMAGPTVEFLGFVPDETLPNLYANATALLMPQLEDAGITPLEAQACGTPVIAYGKGGALDTISNGITGIFFDAQTVESISAAINNFSNTAFNAEVIRTHARQFSATNFKKQLQIIINNAQQAYRKKLD